MYTDPDLVGIVIDSRDASGNIIEATTPSVFYTTASKFAVGCVLKDTNNGKTYTNVGTVASPSWNSVSEVTTAEIADSAVTSAKLDPSTVQTITKALTAAQINALFTTSIEVVPAVTGKAIILDSFVFDLTGTATQFTAGGVVNLQYKNTANGAGTALHADIAAATITGATARVVVQRVPLVAGFAIATADIIAQGVYIGAKTQNFATGTGTANCIVTYHTI